MTQLADTAEPGTEGPTIADEDPLLLNPCTDDPQAHLDFDADGRVNARSEKGRPPRVRVSWAMQTVHSLSPILNVLVLACRCIKTWLQYHKVVAFLLAGF